MLESLICNVPTGLLRIGGYIVFYQYCVPPGLSRQGQYIGRKEDRILLKSRQGRNVF